MLLLLWRVLAMDGADEICKGVLALADLSQISEYVIELQGDGSLTLG